MFIKRRPKWDFIIYESKSLKAPFTNYPFTGKIHLAELRIRDTTFYIFTSNRVPTKLDSFMKLVPEYFAKKLPLIGHLRIWKRKLCWDYK